MVSTLFKKQTLDFSTSKPPTTDSSMPFWFNVKNSNQFRYQPDNNSWALLGIDPIDPEGCPLRLNLDDSPTDMLLTLEAKGTKSMGAPKGGSISIYVGNPDNITMSAILTNWVPPSDNFVIKKINIDKSLLVKGVNEITINLDPDHESIVLIKKVSVQSGSTQKITPQENQNGHTGSITTRKNQKDMTDAEITNFVNAMLKVKKDGDYDKLVYLHQYCYGFNRPSGSPGNKTINWAHNNSGFLSWHRKFLSLLENLLQKADPSVYIPYWDWYNNGKLFSNSFMGGKGDPTKQSEVQDGRFAGSTGNWKCVALSTTHSFEGQNLKRENAASGLTKDGVTNTLNPVKTQPYDQFRSTLEILHGGVHVHIGGHMTTDYSPDDPLFFLHHCNIDRLWSAWQKNNPGKPFYTPSKGTSSGIPGINDDIHPWDGLSYPFESEISGMTAGKVTPEDLLDSTKLGYDYDDLSFF